VVEVDDDKKQALSVADALANWREKERRSARATAQREAAEEAAASAELALEAARSTAKAADAAQTAASEAARAATATADAAHKVLIATRSEGEDRRIMEQEALAAEQEAKAAHKVAQDRAYERLRDDRA
jgi:hypothetical protein